MEQGAAAPKLTATNIILGIIQVSFLLRYFNAGGCRSDKYGRECALFGPKISRTMTSPAPLLQCCSAARCRLTQRRTLQPAVLAAERWADL